MTKFMTLTRAGSESLITVNIAQIKMVERMKDGTAIITLENDLTLAPEQSYMEIIDKLEKVVIG